MNPCVTLFYTMLCFGIKFLSNVYFHLKYMSTVKNNPRIDVLFIRVLLLSRTVFCNEQLL